MLNTYIYIYIYPLGSSKIRLYLGRLPFRIQAPIYLFPIALDLFILVPESSSYCRLAVSMVDIPHAGPESSSYCRLAVSMVDIPHAGHISCITSAYFLTIYNKLLL